MSAMIEIGEVWSTEPAVRRFLKKELRLTIDGGIPANHLASI